MKALTPVEKYVLAYRDTQALFSNLTAAEREEAAQGIRWLTMAGQVYEGPKHVGRPPGSKNRKATVGAEAEAQGRADCLALMTAPNGAEKEGI